MVLWYNHSYVQMCLLIGTVGQISDVTHGFLDSCLIFIMFSHDKDKCEISKKHECHMYRFHL